MMEMFKCLKGPDLAMQGVGMVVKFYGRHRFSVPPLRIPQEDFPLSCEQICVRCAKWLSEHSGKYFLEDSEKTIGPLLQPLFGLYAADHKLVQWIPDAYVFPTSTHQVEFYFRVKVRPVIPRNEEEEDDVVSDSSSMPGGIFTDYLFWQCVEDFYSGRVWSQYSTDIKINDVDCVNKVALWIIVGAANYRLQLQKAHTDFEASNNKVKVLCTPLGELTTLRAIKKTVSFRKLSRHIPETMSKDLQDIYNIKDPFMRWLAKSHLIKYIEKFYEQWKQFPLSYIRQIFIMNFLTKFVPYYLQEMFPVSIIESKGTGEQVHTGNYDLIIRPHMDGCLPGIYRSRVKPVSDLKSIFRADINPFVDSQGNETKECNVVLRTHSSPAPKILKMKNRELALSFLSIVEQYHRLKFRYYASLNEDITAPSLQVLKAFKSYGPMQERAAVHFLKQKRNDKRLHQHETLYLVYQDTDEFDLLHAMLWTRNASNFDIHNIHFDISNSIGRAVFHASFRVRVQEEEKTFCDPVAVISALDLSDDYQLCPKDDEVCEAMRFLKDSSLAEDYYSCAYTECERPDRMRTTNMEHQPFSFRSEQVEGMQGVLKGTGTFCSVHRLSEKVTGNKAVLKTVTDKRPVIQEVYRNGAEHLLKLIECSVLFVRLYGTVISSPFRMVLQEVGTDWNLSKRLQDRSAPSLNIKQIVSVWAQLAECLLHLKNKKLVYGSFSCKKILIHKETDAALTIRLGDASQSQFFDQLAVDDVHNQQRLLLLAPECRLIKIQDGVAKFSKPTPESDVYYFANVMFETLNRCKDPSELLPRGMKIKDFLGGGNTVQDLMLAELRVWEKVPHAQGNNSGTGSSGDAAGSPLQQETSPDLDQASGAADSSGSEQHCYNKVVAAEQGSAVASGTTEMTNLSWPLDDEDKSYNDSLRTFRTGVRSLMEKCWNRHPQQRPDPITVMNDVSVVERLANTLMTASTCSNLLLFLKATEESGCSFQADIGECKLDLQKLQDRLNADVGLEQDGATEQIGKYEKDVVKKLTECNDYLIHPLWLVYDPKDERKKGEGQFGVVRKATLRKPPSDSWGKSSSEEDGDIVAVKFVKDNNQRKEFYKEAFINISLKHENIVQVIGIVIVGKSLQLVMEFADKSSLNHHIKRLECGMPEYKKNMLKYAVDIARGMEYLCQHNNMIHGDLAARNVLLFSAGSATPENFIAKVSDFGFSHRMSRGQNGYFYYDLSRSTGSLPTYWPLPWMAREVVEDLMENQAPRMNFKSDVWSYGVMLWEMFTGLNPFDELNPHGLKFGELLRHLKMFYDRNERLPKGNCLKSIYDIMFRCWAYSDRERPDFTYLLEKLECLTGNDI